MATLATADYIRDLYSLNDKASNRKVCEVLKPRESLLWRHDERDTSQITGVSIVKIG